MAGSRRGQHVHRQGMMTPALDVPSKPTGEARKRDRRRLALLALLLLADAELAGETWDAYAPREFRGLMGAEVFDDIRAARGVALPPMWFDVASQRYGLSNQGFITTPAILNAVDS